MATTYTEKQSFEITPRDPRMTDVFDFHWQDLNPVRNRKKFGSTIPRNIRAVRKMKNKAARKSRRINRKRS